jgi:hypothetical protein
MEEPDQADLRDACQIFERHDLNVIIGG